MNGITKALDKLSPIAVWLLRLSFAAIFLYHGLPKLMMPGAVGKMLMMSPAMVVLPGIFEVGGAILLLIGGFGPDWATRLGGLLPVPVMLVAIFTVHWPQWSFVANEGHKMGGMEFQVLVLIVGLLFTIRGNALASVPQSAQE